MRFDTHLHAWWPGDDAAVRIRAAMPALDRDFSLAATRDALAAAGVSRAVLVSAAQQEDDNSRLLAAAAQHPDLVAGVIGWLDPASPDVAERIARWRREPLWRGIRLPLSIHPDRHHITRPPVRHGLEALAEAGAIVEVLADPDQLADVAAVVADSGELKVIIDHAGLPDFTRPPTGRWLADMARLAERALTTCKISAFWVPGDPPVQDETAFAFFSHVVRCFGTGRVISAANWPPSVLAGPYGWPWLLIDRLCERGGLAARDRSAILFDNAEALFARPGTSGVTSDLPPSSAGNARP